MGIAYCCPFFGGVSSWSGVMSLLYLRLQRPPTEHERYLEHQRFHWCLNAIFGCVESALNLSNDFAFLRDTWESF